LDVLVDRAHLIYIRPRLLPQLRDVTDEMAEFMRAEEKAGKYWPYPNTPDGDWTRYAKETQPANKKDP
jgi:hypothetical protein